MKLQQLLDSLALPIDAHIDKRIPKKTFLENANLGSADKKIVQEDVEEIFWLAALKPSNVGVLAYKDEVREYLEIAVLTVKLRSKPKIGKLASIFHRAVPYPVLLTLETSEGLYLSVAHKRWAQINTENSVVENIQTSNLLSFSNQTSFDVAFLKSISIAQLSRLNMFSMYHSWALALEAYSAACVTGKFIPPHSWQDFTILKSNLTRHADIISELKVLKNRVSKEKQLNRLVQLNAEIKSLEVELAAVKHELEGEQGE